MATRQGFTPSRRRRARKPEDGAGTWTRGATGDYKQSTGVGTLRSGVAIGSPKMRGSIEHGCNEVRCGVAGAKTRRSISRTDEEVAFGVAGARIRGSIWQTDGEDSFGVALCKGTIIWHARSNWRQLRAKGERNSSQDHGNVASGDRKH